MTPEQHRYIFVQTAIGSAIVNAGLNALAGWGVTRGLAEFPIWKVPGAAPDLMATAFGVAFGTCIGIALQVKVDLAKGKITAPQVAPSTLALVQRLPRWAVVRGLGLGLASVLLFATPVLAALFALQWDALGQVPFVVTKTVFSMIEGAVLAPYVMLSTLLIHAESARVSRGAGAGLKRTV